MKMENWAAEDSTEIKTARWTIQKNQLFEASKQIRNIITNALSFDLHKDQVKALFVATGLQSSKTMTLNPTGELVETSSGKILTDKEAYALFVNEHPKNKNYIRALEEIGVVLGLSTLNYYAGHLLFSKKENPNKEDWDYLKGFQRIRFDDNSPKTNIGHSLAGAVYYQLARANKLTSMESFLMSFAASAFWEIFSERWEVIAINDQILTPVGGLAIGESGYQFGRYFYAKNNVIGKILSGIFDPSSMMNRLFDGRRKDMAKYEARQSGFDVEAMTGYADFYVGKIQRSLPDLVDGKADGKKEGRVFGMDGEVNLIPYKDQAGHEREFYRDTTASKILLQVTGDNKDSFQTIDALFKSVLMAYHAKEIVLDEAGRRNGYSAIIGVSNGMSYNFSKFEKAEKPEDWIASIHVLGGTIDVTAFYKDIQFRASIDVFGDFAMVRAYSIDSYKAANGVTGYQSTLARYDYYYNTGMTTMLNLSAESGRNTFALAVRRSDYHSTSGHDRYHDTLTNELQSKDQMTDTKLSWSYQISKNWRAKVIYQQIKRSGAINNAYATSGTERRLMGTINYRF